VSTIFGPGQADRVGRVSIERRSRARAIESDRYAG
jgi:hypothetical protein